MTDKLSGDTCVQVMHDEPCYTAIADELTRLRAQNAALVEALEKIANGDGVYGAQAHEYKQIARAALAQAESDQ